MAAALRRFWNWLCFWRKREVVLDDPYSTIEQLDAALADPDLAKHFKRGEVRQDPAAGTPGMVRGADGVWRSIGDTPMVSIKMFIGSEDEEIEAARPKIIQPQGKSSKCYTTCGTCFGWGVVGEMPCGTCRGKGYVWR